VFITGRMFVRTGIIILLFVALVPTTGIAEDTATLPENYCTWEVKAYAIEKPLCGLSGDARRGQKIVSDSHLGN